MLSQSFNRSTAIRRNSFGYFPTRLFATCSSFPCKCALSECLKLRVQSTVWQGAWGEICLCARVSDTLECKEPKSRFVRVCITSTSNNLQGSVRLPSTCNDMYGDAFAD